MRTFIRLTAGVAAACTLAGQAFAQVAPRQAAPNIDHGRAVFELWCAGCHHSNPALQRNGQVLVGRVFAGTYTLEQRYQGAKPAALEERTDLDPSYVRFVVRHGLNMMPLSRKVEISDDDLDDVAAYLTRNNR
jgi:mono/diheme cytochrome c family protein